MGAAPTVSNSGTSAAAVFDFGLAPGFVAAEATAFPVSPSLWEVVNRTDLAETFIYLPNGGSPIWRQL